MKIVYFYDENGFITGTNTSNWPDGHPFLSQPNTIVLDEPIKAVMTTEHDGAAVDEEVTIKGDGWSFVLENGTPKQDGEGFVLKAPEVEIQPPDILTHIFAGLVNTGAIDLADVDPKLTDAINWSLNAAGARILQGTNLKPKPIRSVKRG